MVAVASGGRGATASTESCTSSSETDAVALVPFAAALAVGSGIAMRTEVPATVVVKAVPPGTRLVATPPTVTVTAGKA
ncbi:hypothetical protein OVA14_03075 [Agrococcus sp. SL85]|uniref:hypothetical protein n=1 Tax=Agrococcus sp. SL85 TaxID=2995141 RepID=UPI00226D2700|nr:hypothetical protein [Agrococcus sp. SL85]WAC66773.1 hypothetical protein OVA14_03075 [Agrococcus sp. SL85]